MDSETKMRNSIGQRISRVFKNYSDAMGFYGSIPAEWNLFKVYGSLVYDEGSTMDIELESYNIYK